MWYTPREIPFEDEEQIKIRIMIYIIRLKGLS